MLANNNIHDVKGQASAASVTMETPNFLVNQPDYILCRLFLTSKDYINIQKNTIPGSTISIGPTRSSNDHCEVSSFVKCDPGNNPALKNYTCGCLHKGTSSKQSWHYEYSFYLYFSDVDIKLNDEQYECKLKGGSSRGVGTITVYSLSSTMGSLKDVCIGTPIVLSWEYDHDCTTGMPKLQSVSWYKKDSCGRNITKREKLATYVFNKKGSNAFQVQTQTSLSTRLGHAVTACNFVQLKIDNATAPDDGCYVIEANLDPNNTIRRYKRSTLFADQDRHQRYRRQAAQALQAPATTPTTVTTAQSPVPTPTVKLATNPAPPSTTLPSATVGTTQKTFFVVNAPTVMRHSTFVRVNRPPKASLRLEFSGRRMVHGSIALTCQVLNIEKNELGVPPVNISIFQEDVSGSRSMSSKPTLKHTLTLAHFSTVNTNYTCQLEGPALQCISAKDPRRLPVFFDASSLIPKDDEGEMDSFLILYAIEFTCCILLLLWTLMLTVDHVSVIVKRKKFLALRNARDQLEQWNYKFERPE